MRLEGSLDVGALDAALSDVVARHDILRTVIETVAGEPRQRLLPASARTGVLTVEPGPFTDEELARRIGEMASYRFDLAREAPLRVGLLGVRADTWALVLNVHHVASDGWSTAVLAHDVSTAYRARVEGRCPDWPELPVRYATSVRSLGKDTSLKAVKGYDDVTGVGTPANGYVQSYRRP